jgi:hypothetical protein
MFVPAWAIRLAPYIGGALLIVAAYAWAYGNGKEAERAKWQKREAAAVEAAQAKERALQAQVDAAGVALSEMSAAIASKTDRAVNLTRTYYVENPASNVACLDASRLRHISESDTAATAAGTAK